jgi:hypothetical protein
MKVFRLFSGFIIGWVLASICTSLLIAAAGFNEISSTTDSIKVTAGLIGGLVGVLVAYKKNNPKMYED